MIYRVEIASEMSAFQAARVGDDGRHGFLFEGRDGAGDESTGSNFASRGEEDLGGDAEFLLRESGSN
jgi:hypothetical protein